MSDTLNSPSFSFDWPRAGTAPLAQALLRATPEDFIVEEQSRFLPEGSGEHLWVRIRKRGVNTEFVARALARIAGVPARAVSFAGMKDRHAVTVQWFSIHLPGRESPAFDGGLPAGVEVLEAKRHARKLQRGALAGNGFEITLRDCVGDRDALMERVSEIAVSGVPNYFGEQRFGRGGDNVTKALAMFAGEPVRDRHLRGIYLSAARSYLFNDVLRERVRNGSWRQALAGEVLILNGTNSFFVPQAIDATIETRLMQADVHPSGPMWGAGDLPSSQAVGDLEQRAAMRFPALAAGLAQQDLAHERRSLRLLPQRLVAQWTDSATLRLSFGLAAGCYATAILRELALYQDRGSAGLDAV